MTRPRNPLLTALLAACLLLAVPAIAQAGTAEFASSYSYATNGFSHTVHVNVTGGPPSTPIKVFWSLNQNGAGATAQPDATVSLDGSGAGTADLPYTPNYAPGGATDVVSAVCADINNNASCDAGDAQPTSPTTHTVYVGEPYINVTGTTSYNTGATASLNVLVETYGDYQPMTGQTVQWSRSGANGSTSSTVTTDGTGNATIPSWDGLLPGTDTLYAWVDDPLGTGGTRDSGEGYDYANVVFTQGTITLNTLNAYYRTGVDTPTVTATVYSDGNNGATTPIAGVGAGVTIDYSVNGVHQTAVTNASSQISFQLSSSTNQYVSVQVWRDVVNANQSVDTGEPSKSTSTSFNVAGVTSPSQTPSYNLGIGEHMTFSFTSRDFDYTALPNQQVCWRINSGPDNGAQGSTMTDGGGAGTFIFSGTGVGTDSFQLWLASQSPCGSAPIASANVATASATWTMAIISSGPVTAIYQGPTMQCEARYVLDTYGEFYGNTYGPGSCRTYVFIDGVQRSSFQAVSQTGPTPVAGGGFEVDTTVCIYITSCPSAPDPLLTQKVTYFPGDNYYRVDYSLQDRDGASHTVRIYQYADCYLQNSDRGYGFHSDIAAGGNGGIYCAANPDNQPSGRIEGFVPVDPGAAYYEAGFGTVSSAIGSSAGKTHLFDNGSGTDVSNTCDCDPAPHSSIDNGMAIGWEGTLPAGGTFSRSLLTDFSPSGVTADIYPPGVTLDVPVDGSTTTNTQPTFSGTAGSLPGDIATVSVNVYSGTSASGSPVTTISAPVSSGAWSAQPGSPLALGTYTAQAEQSDAAGNTGRSAPHTFTVASAPPNNPPPPVQPLPPPVFRQSVNVTPVGGTVFVTEPGGKKVALKSPDQIKLGSVIDTSDGRVRLTIEDKTGKLQSAEFFEGVFKVTQLPKKKGGSMNLKLIPEDHSFKECPVAKKSRASKGKKLKKTASVDHLWGSGTGSFRTQGRYSAAAVRGTTWLTDDRCDGTLTRVTAGLVTVHDDVRDKDVVVKKGQKYLAKP